MLAEQRALAAGRAARARALGAGHKWWARQQLRRSSRWGRRRRPRPIAPCAAALRATPAAHGPSAKPVGGGVGEVLRMPGVSAMGMATPLHVLGPEGISNWAERLTRTLAEHGLVRFTEEQIATLRLLTERQFGPGAGARLGRVAALVHRLSQGRLYEKNVPGQGRQCAASYIEGLEPDRPFHDVAAHPWTAALAAGAGTVLEELREQVEPAMWSRAGKALEGKMYAPEWRIIGLVSSGIWLTDRFPKTKEVVCSLHGMRPYEVLFARMPARTKIGAHSDNMNYIMTAHMGLDLEEGACFIRVGDQARQWRVGKVIVFDTSYIHSATNDSSRDRYILLIRFWHPGISDEERYALMSQLLILNAMKKHEAASVLFKGGVAPAHG